MVPWSRPEGRVTSEYVERAVDVAQLSSCARLVQAYICNTQWRSNAMGIEKAILSLGSPHYSECFDLLFDVLKLLGSRALYDVLAQKPISRR
jgi:hypothetical protein